MKHQNAVLQSGPLLIIFVPRDPVTVCELRDVCGTNRLLGYGIARFKGHCGEHYDLVLGMKMALKSALKYVNREGELTRELNGFIWDEFFSKYPEARGEHKREGQNA